MRHVPPSLLWLVALLPGLSPAVARAQIELYPEYDRDDPRSGSYLPTPAHVEALEAGHGVPPCGGAYWGRSRLDGGLASRLRSAELPCRDVWSSVVRLELGLVGGGLVDVGDGGWGGLSLQLGLRFHETFSVFFQSLALFGGWDLSPGTRVAGASWNAFLLELSPTGLIGFAVGPSMDVEGECALDVAQSPTTCGYRIGYAGHARVTLRVAELPFGGLTLTGDLHAGFGADAPSPTMLLGLGLRL